MIMLLLAVASGAFVLGLFTSAVAHSNHKEDELAAPTIIALIVLVASVASGITMTVMEKNDKPTANAAVERDAR